MKRYVLWLLLLLICGNIFPQFKRDSPGQVEQNYMPLHIGNKYQYYSIQSSGQTIYRLSQKVIEKDTVAHGFTYYYYTYPTAWMRYSEADKKIYLLVNDSDKVYMDFTKAPGDTFYMYDGSSYHNAEVLGGNTTVFFQNCTYKGYAYNTGSYFITYDAEYFTENIGPYMHEFAISGGPVSGSSTTYLIGLILYDSLGNSHYYSYNYKPEISLTPITMINKRNFLLDFTVLHHYSHIPYGVNFGFDYIDSVRFESFYSKGDSVINNPLMTPTQIKIGSYQVSLNLDTLLLKNGFTFNYKIYAADKSLLPEVSFSPDKGYYKCVWNFPSEVDDSKEIISGYRLFQNYPNPFNPATTIKYSVPCECNISIKVINTLGQVVRDFNVGTKQSGLHELQLDASNLSSGVYFFSINAAAVNGEENYSSIKKMILLK